MARHKDVLWSLKDTVTSWDKAHAAILMDIRDELKKLNSLLHCPRFQAIPTKLDYIKANTTNRKRKAKLK